MPAAASRACCGDGAMPASQCLTALGDQSLKASAFGGAPSLDLASPIRVYLMAVAVDLSSASIRIPVTSVGPPLHSYIVFSRFLS